MEEMALLGEECEFVMLFFLKNKVHISTLFDYVFKKPSFSFIVKINSF